MHDNESVLSHRVEELTQQVHLLSGNRFVDAITYTS